MEDLNPYATRKGTMATEMQLREFGRLICRVAAGDYLTREESVEAYRQVILNEQPELQQFPPLAAFDLEEAVQQVQHLGVSRSRRSAPRFSGITDFL